MNNIGLVMLFTLFSLFLSGCEDKGYGTQDITVVPSVTGTDAMLLQTSIPRDGGVVAQRAYINLSFSSYLDESSVTNAQVRLLKNSTALETEFLVLRNYIFIKPLMSLEVNQSYTVQVDGLKDIFGNDLDQAYTLHYRCTSNFWKSAVAGSSNSMAESKAGNLYIWGSNAPLPIDTESEEIKIITLGMPIPVPKSRDAKSYDVGPNTMAVVTQEGYVIELGLSAFRDSDDNSYKMISTGASHSVVLKEDGTIFSWGSNNSGQLGASLILNSTSAPIQEYREDHNWSAVSAGTDFTIALKKDGTVWGWGDNTFGQVGRKFDTIPLPLELNTSGTTIGTVTQISAGGTHTLALDDNHMLWAWGNNRQGELGDGTNTLSRQGVAVADDHNWSFVSAGYDHTLAVDQAHSLWSWGNNGSGQLGVGSTIDANKPVEVNATLQWKQVSGGKNYSLGVTTDGRLWAWGTNTYLRLGLDESVVETAVPMEVK